MSIIGKSSGWDGQAASVSGRLARVGALGLATRATTTRLPSTSITRTRAPASIGSPRVTTSTRRPSMRAMPAGRSSASTTPSCPSERRASRGSTAAVVRRTCSRGLTGCLPSGLLRQELEPEQDRRRHEHGRRRRRKSRCPSRGLARTRTAIAADHARPPPRRPARRGSGRGTRARSAASPRPSRTSERHAATLTRARPQRLSTTSRPR